MVIHGACLTEAATTFLQPPQITHQRYWGFSTPHVGLSIGEKKEREGSCECFGIIEAVFLFVQLNSSSN